MFDDVVRSNELIVKLASTKDFKEKYMLHAASNELLQAVKHDAIDHLQKNGIDLESIEVEVGTDGMGTLHVWAEPKIEREDGRSERRYIN